MLWAYENSVTTGTSEYMFSPNSGASRAQVATFLYRALNETETPVDPVEPVDPDPVDPVEPTEPVDPNPRSLSSRQNLLPKLHKSKNTLRHAQGVF